MAVCCAWRDLELSRARASIEAFRPCPFGGDFGYPANHLTSRRPPTLRPATLDAAPPVAVRWPNLQTCVTAPVGIRTDKYLARPALSPKYSSPYPREPIRQGQRPAPRPARDNGEVEFAQLVDASEPLHGACKVVERLELPKRRPLS